ncbi:hypothetical protein CVIRNUC_000239 [Coccomyxa viridis]|uniref:Uncharacterized protein n=1 Tax=Coccomyxa viridis TaxID=1274662 RepID=A0AAV1HSF7_9CHLO|nr:hypothetical protein CVIRNUC_000239 [Coccomyxa viridis]
MVFCLIAALYTLLAPQVAGQIESFAEPFLKAKECILHNYVPVRGDDYGHDGPGIQPWSVNWHTYAGNKPDALQYCSSTELLLESLKSGIRMSLNSIALDDIALENAEESWFQPHRCAFRWFTWRKACQVLGKFSQVYMIGDSMMRHIHHALLMLLKDDWQYGSLPLKLDGLNQYEQCHCDGQFSEHALCREHIADTATMNDPRQFGLCMGSSSRPFALHSRERGLYDGYKLMWDNSTCTDLDRPVFIFMGIGAHHHHEAHRTTGEGISPVMKEIDEAAAACPHVTFHKAFIGLHAQSRTLDHKYPGQTRELMIDFNIEVSRYLREKHAMDYFDPWNLTKNAPTSDGYHQLSDVNLVKAMYLLNYLDMLLG